MADKFEREIEDILNRLDKFPRQSPADRARRAVSGRVSAFQRRIAIRLAALSISQIMLAGIVMILVGFFFRSALPGLWSYLVILGLILFFTTFVLSFFGAGRSGRPRQIYWRGRPASYYESGPSLAERLRAWWRRRQGHRY